MSHRVAIDVNVLVGAAHLIDFAVAGAADFIVTHNVRDVARGELTFPDLQILIPTRFLRAI